MNEIIDIVDIPRRKKKSFKGCCKNFINKVFTLNNFFIFLILSNLICFIMMIVIISNIYNDTLQPFIDMINEKVGYLDKITTIEKYLESMNNTLTRICESEPIHRYCVEYE